MTDGMWQGYITLGMALTVVGVIWSVVLGDDNERRPGMPMLIPAVWFAPLALKLFFAVGVWAVAS